MVLGRLLLMLLATLVLVTTANASSAAPAAAPDGLRAFLFRADEPVRHEFARTPAFAWSPVAGARRYEFELSTTSVFRENGIIFAARDLKTPVASVQLTLPWITGSPYSLYARVRAVTRSGATAWSKPYGFNLRQPDVPRPLPSFAGLLRWTPVEGAGGYEIWLIDVNKKLVVNSNVLDQREVYTFHQSDPWIANVRWRIRTLRWDVTTDEAKRMNGMPITSYGPWSPVYESKNPSLDTGPLRLVGTVSDVVARGASTDPAHRLMPAFVFSGTKGFDGVDAELFRVYVFTDRDCLNRVFTGSIVGSPSFAPRPFGPLALPRSAAALNSFRGAYMPDGDEGTTYMHDGERVTPSESAPQATPTTSLPGSQVPTPPPASGDGTTPAPAPVPTTGAVSFLKVEGNLGAPIDLWDTNWPEGGYYWTVVPVDAASSTSVTTSLADSIASGETSVTVAESAGFGVGDVITIGTGTTKETVTVATVSGNVITLTQPLRNTHAILEEVARASGTTVYTDRELPQEACASGRVMRFGKNSEPALVSAGMPFVSGLSPKGRLTTATGGTSRFYSSPLVAWTPSLGADAYHVQWSKKRTPFAPEAVSWQDKGVAAGFLTFANSAVLPLQPGTWWYRVRGVSFSLPTNAQFMAWSDPARIAVSKPTFKVAKPKPKKKR